MGERRQHSESRIRGHGSSPSPLWGGTRWFLQRIISVVHKESGRLTRAIERQCKQETTSCRKYSATDVILDRLTKVFEVSFGNGMRSSVAAVTRAVQKAAVPTDVNKPAFAEEHKSTKASTGQRDGSQSLKSLQTFQVQEIEMVMQTEC